MTDEPKKPQSIPGIDELDLYKVNTEGGGPTGETGIVGDGSELPTYKLPDQSTVLTKENIQDVAGAEIRGAVQTGQAGGGGTGEIAYNTGTGTLTSSPYLIFGFNTGNPSSDLTISSPTNASPRIILEGVSGTVGTLSIDLATNPNTFVLSGSNMEFDFSSLIFTGTSGERHLGIGAISTTNATPTDFTIDTLSASGVLFVEATIMARRTGGSSGVDGDSAVYVRRGAFKIVSGVASVLGSIQDVFTVENQSAWDATLAIFSGTTVGVEVTGAANTNITWQITLEYSQRNFT